ncbi:MAG: response regulator [Verrucomicrobiae bacterium]|nr:response regulator [Verrucomicrobiae bacterium]
MLFFKKEKKRVLVVDDEQSIVDITCEFLQDDGYETCSARNTRGAMAEMEKNPVHAMLLDINLAGEDGLAFLAEFKKKYPSVPVVILTGAGYDDEMMQSALKNGASGYVSKDTDLGNLVVAVKRVLR